MGTHWLGTEPLYRQLREQAVGHILDGSWKEGQPLPSVRRVAADLGVSPLTVLRAYRQLLEEQLIAKQRGRGLYLLAGARERLRNAERLQFIERQWPQIQQKLLQLGLQLSDLPSSAALGNDSRR